MALDLHHDLVANTVSLPEDKVASMLPMLDVWISATHASDRQLALLVGRLLYAAICIRSGRLLTNRVLATKRLAAAINRPVIIDEACKADLRWWKAAITLRNDVSFLEHDSIIGGTIYPGLLVTASFFYHIFNYVNVTIYVREVCVFLAPGFSSLTAFMTYLLTKELHSTGAGLCAAGMISIVPGYISHSVAGS